MKKQYREIAAKLMRLEIRANELVGKTFHPRYPNAHHTLDEIEQRIAGMRSVLVDLGVDVWVERDEYAEPVAVTIGGVKVTRKEVK